MSSTDAEAHAKSPPASRSASRSAPRARRGVSLAEQLVERLTLQIRAGEIAPGAKLPTEAEIIATHGVSRTVVREALSRLSAAGLTQTHHCLCPFVREALPVIVFFLYPSHMTTMVELLSLLKLLLLL